MKFNNGKTFIFLQPALFYEKKKLTNEEKEYFDLIDFVNKRREVYNLFKKTFNTKMNDTDFKIYPMFDIFENINRKIYTDEVHINTEGNWIMAKFIKNKLIQNNIIIKNK